jgi:type I restriction enzyme, S subunit
VTVPTSWPDASLGDCVDLLTGFPFRSTEYTDNPNDIRLLRGDNVAQGVLRWDDAKKWASHKVEDLQAYELKKGDVVLAMDRPWIEAGLKYAWVRETDLPSLLVQRVARLRGKPGILETTFLRYIVGASQFTEHIKAVTTGTAVPHISPGGIKTYKITLPPLSIQRRIAEILGRLDDKIEVNRRINRTLEAMAQALYRHWFVEFGPFRDGEFVDSELGAIPRGWEVKPVAALVELLSGGTPHTTVAEYWNGDINWVSAKDVVGSTPFIMSTERTITEAGVQNSATNMLPPFTTIITARGTVGACGLLPRAMAMNQTNYGIRGTGILGDFTTYLLIRNTVAELQQHAYGTVFDTITRKTFEGVKVAVPSGDIWTQFETKVEPWFLKMLACQHEIAKLTKICDYLLPKLLAGEVKV